MGRSYKTQIPAFIQGSIEEPPIELMDQALQAHEDRYKKASEEANAFEDMVKDLENIKYDNPEINASLNKYSSEFDSIAQGINGDPANYQSYLPKINSLRKKLDDDLSRGLLGRGQENLQQRGDIVKQLEASGASSKRVQDITNFLDKSYQEKGGLAFEDPNTYNKFVQDGQEIRGYKDFDNAKFLNNLQARFAKDGTSYASAGPGGGYLWTKNGHTEFIKEGDVANHMKSYLADSEWEDTNRQDVMLEGFNDKNLRGAELDNYITEKLAERQENFTNAAVEQIAFKNETRKNAGVSVDGKALNDTNYMRGQEQYNNLTIVNEDVDRLSSNEKLNLQKTLSIMGGDNSIGGAGGSISPEQVLGIYRRDPDNFSANMQKTSWYGALSPVEKGQVSFGALLNSYNKQGTLSNNLVPFQNGATGYDQLSPEEKIAHVNRENTLKKEIIGTTMSQDAEYTIGGSNETTLAGSGSIHNLIQDGTIRIQKVGGGLMDVPISLPTRNLKGQYVAANGQPIPYSQYYTPQQALNYSQTHGLPLKMESTTNIQQYFNNDANLNSAKVERFTNVAGDAVFETTVPIMYTNPETGIIESVDLIIKKDTEDYSVDGQNL